MSALFHPPSPHHFFQRAFGSSSQGPSHTLVWGSKEQNWATQARLARYAAEQGAAVWVIGESLGYLSRFEAILPADSWVSLSPNVPANINVFNYDASHTTLYDSLRAAVEHLRCILDIPEKLAFEALNTELDLVDMYNLNFRGLVLLADEMRKYAGLSESSYSSLKRTLSWYVGDGYDSFQGWRLDPSLTAEERAHAVRLAILRLMYGLSSKRSAQPKLICIEDATWLSTPMAKPELNQIHSSFVENFIRSCRAQKAVVLSGPQKPKQGAMTGVGPLCQTFSSHIGFPGKIVQADIRNWS